ncbi:MAG: cyclic nucleotide-binding domain-containing protein [Pseudomonadota bacterium]
MIDIDRENVLSLFGANWTREPRAAGEQVIMEGRLGDIMFLVQDGLLELTASGQLLDMVKAGDVFGEMSLIDGEPRSASVAVIEDATLIPIDRAAFRRLVSEHPDFSLYVMRSLATRIRRMNEVVVKD